MFGIALSKDLNRQICDFDFEWVESHLKRPLPPAFKLLFITGKVFALENIIVDEGDLDFCGAHWEPQNRSYYSVGLAGHARSVDPRAGQRRQ